MSKKKKISGKAVAIGAAVLIGVGAIAGGGGAKKDAAPQPTEGPVRTVATATPVPTPSPVPTPTPYRIHGMDPQRTVYVSNSGVIHVESDCSGMKHYKEMALEDAAAAGYEYCSKCIW